MRLITTIASTTWVVVSVIARGAVVACEVWNHMRRGSRSRDAFKFDILIEKLLVNLSMWWMCVTTIYLICNRLIFLRETIQNVFNLVFLIKWFTYQRQLGKASGETFKEFIDRLASFLPVAELLTNLLDMTSTWLSIGWCERALYICCRCGHQKEWLQVHGAPSKVL